MHTLLTTPVRIVKKLKYRIRVKGNIGDFLIDYSHPQIWPLLYFEAALPMSMKTCHVLFIIVIFRCMLLRCEVRAHMIIF